MLGDRYSNPSPQRMTWYRSFACISVAIIISMVACLNSNATVCDSSCNVVVLDVGKSCSCVVNSSISLPDLVDCLSPYLCVSLKISGTIDGQNFPENLTSLPTIENVTLSLTSFVGVDTEPFTTLPSIKILDLIDSYSLTQFPGWTQTSLVPSSITISSSSISSFPPSLLASRLTLESNILVSIDDLVSAPNLISLSLAECANLTVFPNVPNPSILQTLDISQTAVTDLPPTIGSFSSLLTLDISGNLIVTVPNEFSALSTLQEWKMESTSISNVSQAIVDGLTSLQRWHGGGSLLASLPELSSLISLSELKMQSNLLTTLRFSISTPHISYIDVSQNQLTQIPSLLSATNLTYLDVSNNLLTSLPSLPSMLSILKIGKNNITDIPDTITDSNITVLAMNEIGLTSYPTQINGLTSVSILILSGNAIGSIPVSFHASLQNIHTFVCRKCGLNDDSLPANLCNDRFENLVLADNEFTKFPITLATCYNLTYLDMSGNYISSVSPILSHSLRSHHYLNMEDNPSVCFSAVSQMTKQVELLCECDASYVGYSYCESILNYVYVTSLGTSVTSLDFNIPVDAVSYPLLGNNVVVSESALSLSENAIGSFSVQFSDLKTHAYPIIRSAFADNSLSFSVVQVNLVLNVFGNALLPSPSFTLVYAALPAYSLDLDGCDVGGLDINPDTVALEGTPTKPIRSCLVNGLIEDISTSESKEFARILLSVVECGDGSCANNGTCIMDNNAYDGVFSCDCPGGYGGTLCNVAQSPSASASSLSTSVVAGISIAGVLAGILLGYIIYKIVIFFRKRKHYHFFISYRQWCDKEIAEELYKMLRRRFLKTGHRVSLFWDKKSLKTGLDWKDGFQDGLRHSCVYIPLLSSNSLADIKKITLNTEKEDNFLLEMEMALKFHKQKRIQILPLAINGKSESGQVIPFNEFDPNVFPNHPSRTSRHSIRHTMTRLLRHQALVITPNCITDGDIDAIVNFLQVFAWDIHSEESLRFVGFYKEAKDYKDKLESVSLDQEHEDDEILIQWLGDILKADVNNISSGLTRFNVNRKRRRIRHLIERVRGSLERADVKKLQRQCSVV
eukprot:m.96113 g.96113  ORF g.96113 m.96113 type:complete len:1081 (+) comp8961_c0_seq4:44-3286(+)